MIRTVRIPRTVSRMGSLGLVQAGDGGSASSYNFDSTGLSSDPNLASYLQDLTPDQLQSALNGEDPTATIQSQLVTDLNTPILLPNAPESLSTALGLPGVPSWAWIAGGVGLALLLLAGGRR